MSIPNCFHTRENMKHKFYKQFICAPEMDTLQQNSGWHAEEHPTAKLISEQHNCPKFSQ